MTFERPTVPGPWIARLVLVGLLAAVSLGLAACGDSAKSPTILDTEKVERAIESSSLTQRGVKVQVSCPSGVHQQEGLTFDCTAVSKTGSTRFVVTQLDGSGQVHYEAP